MPDNEAGVLVTHKQIRDWEEQIATLQRKVAAAKEILGFPAPTPIVMAAGAGKSSFMGAIVDIANGERPLSRKEIRERLLDMGFPREQISQQFNTVLYKTKQVGRTSFRDDGKIWKGTKK